MADAARMLRERGITNPDTCLDELLERVVGEICDRWDAERQVKPLGPGLLVHELRKVTTEQIQPSAQKNDLRTRHTGHKRNYQRILAEMDEWPELRVMRLIDDLEGEEIPVSVARLKMGLGPSPLDTDPDRAGRDITQRDFVRPRRGDEKPKPMRPMKDYPAKEPKPLRRLDPKKAL